MGLKCGTSLFSEGGGGGPTIERSGSGPWAQGLGFGGLGVQVAG